MRNLFMLLMLCFITHSAIGTTSACVDQLYIDDDYSVKPDYDQQAEVLVYNTLDPPEDLLIVAVDVLIAINPLIASLEERKEHFIALAISKTGGRDPPSMKKQAGNSINYLDFILERAPTLGALFLSYWRQLPKVNIVM